MQDLGCDFWSQDLDLTPSMQHPQPLQLGALRCLTSYLTSEAKWAEFPLKTDRFQPKSLTINPCNQWKSKTFYNKLNGYTSEFITQ